MSHSFHVGAVVPDAFRAAQRAQLAAMTDSHLRVRYQGACDACDRSDAHGLCVEMRRRRMPIPAWPGIHELPEEVAAATPPGMMLLAVLREADGPWEADAVRRAVMLTYPDPSVVRDAFERDIIHARASGLMTESHGGRTWALASSPRVDAILATMPTESLYAQHARVAWEVASR